MSERGACDTCRFWNNSVGLRDQEDSGRCLALPPRADWRTAEAVWPFTTGSDWCAVYTRDPEAKD